MVLLRRPLLPLVLCFLAFACSSRTSGMKCEPACEGGTVCVNGLCERLCSRDADCSGQCCTEGVCGECSLSSPEITAVNGTGSEDADSSSSTQRIVDRLVIDGKGFTGAQVTLKQGASEVELQLCASEPERLVALLPAGLGAGEYTLTVTNQAGACSTQISLLRGESAYTIGDSSQSGLILDGATLAVDPQFIVDVVNDAKPELYTLYVAHQEFLPETGTWLRADYGTWRHSAEAGTTARAPLRLPDGATIVEVQCRAKGGLDHALSLNLQRISRSGEAHAAAWCAGESLTAIGVVSLPMCSPNDAVDSDLESASYRTYSLAATTNATTNAAVIYGCTVTYSRP